MENTYTELYEKLARLQWLLHRAHIQTHTARGPMGDPTRGQGRVLTMLKLQPEISTKDLSYLLGIRQQSLNELLNKLEKAGYVTRTPSDEDRRVMLVKLTEKGKSEQQEKADFSDIFDCLSAEEQTNFSNYLDRIIAALEEQFGDEPDKDMYDWMSNARERLGDKFEQLMAMRGGAGMAAGFCAGPGFARDGVRPVGFRPGGFGFGPDEEGAPEPPNPPDPSTDPDQN